jgi:hypothetical protein
METTNVRFSQRRSRLAADFEADVADELLVGKRLKIVIARGGVGNR